MKYKSTPLQSPVYISLIILSGPRVCEMLKHFKWVLSEHLIVSNPYFCFRSLIHGLINESDTDSLGLEQ